MKHKCKITVIKKECYEDLQARYLANPGSGPCPMFEVGQEFILEGEDFYHMMDGKFCAEAWDAISRYVYTALQGGSIMNGWTNDEKMMIACCNDVTRPVIFKIQRMDYKVVKIAGLAENDSVKIKSALEIVPGVDSVEVKPEKGWAEVFIKKDASVPDESLKAAVAQDTKYHVTGID